MQNWKENSIDFIGKIGDLNFQYAIWLNHSFWDEILNFGEAVNKLEDYFFFEKVENGSIRFDEKELQVNLVAFSNNLLSYEEPKKVEEMLEDESWLNIVGQARVIYLNSNLLILEE